MTIILVVTVFAVAFLAFSNGANDNFKGVATLLGSKTCSYKVALGWATLTTFVGACAAFFLAQKLLVNFSGKGLVPDDIVQTSSFAASVAMAAACTVFMATRWGLPISTTHALTGALVGAGLVASSDGVNTTQLYKTFFLPLSISPLLAIVSALLLYPAFKILKRKMKVQRESCLCIGKEIIATTPMGLEKGTTSAAMLQIADYPKLSLGTNVTCEERYVGQFWGVSAKSLLDVSHFLSSGLVSFARGLNDTPKIAAILLVGSSLSGSAAIVSVGVIMAVGGLIMARRIAKTMSYDITEMNDGQGFTANFITSAIVIGASQLGVPVSTTHVSCGALFGIGAITKQAHWRPIIKIVLSWLVTLPVAGGLSYLFYSFLRGLN